MKYTENSCRDLRNNKQCVLFPVMNKFSYSNYYCCNKIII